MSSVGSKGRNNGSSRYRVASGENRFTVTSRLLESINRTTSFIERGSPPCVTIKLHGSSETCGVTAAAGSTFGGLYRFKNRSTQFDWAAAVVVNSAKSRIPAAKRRKDIALGVLLSAAPSGLRPCLTVPTQGLRPGLFSFAASRLLEPRSGAKTVAQGVSPGVCVIWTPAPKGRKSPASRLLLPYMQTPP